VIRRARRAIVPLASLFPSLLPALARAAEEGEKHQGSHALIWQLANFAVLVVILVWFVGPQLREFLFQRRKQIADQLEEARRLVAEAEAKDAEWRAKLEALEQECRGIVSQAQEIGRLEREKILEQAARQAKRIQEDAKRAADQELSRAKAELRDESIRLAMGLAEGILKEKIQAGDQQRLVEEYLRMIGRAS